VPSLAGLLFFVPRARRALGAYRIPWRPAFSSHGDSGRVARQELFGDAAAETFCPGDAYGSLEADRAWVIVDTFSDERGSWDLSLEQRLVIERGSDGLYAIRDRIKDAWDEKGDPFIVWGIETMEDAELIRNHLVEHLCIKHFRRCRTS
jgi:hypothetical protein